MSQRGYGAVGVAEVCQQAGVNKGSFYHFFNSKQRLGLEVIDLYWGQTEAFWRSHLLAVGKPPLLRLRMFLKAIHGNLAEQKDHGGCVTGCLLGNFSLELSNQDDVVQKRLAEILREQRVMVQAVLEEAQATGDLGAHIDPESTALAILTMFQGAVMLAKVQNSSDVLKFLPQQVFALLGAN